MTKCFLLACLLVLGACGDGFESEKKSDPDRYQNPVVGPESLLLNERYLQLLNEHRAKLGLRPLTYNQDIEEIAFTHSRGMGVYVRPLGHSAMNIRCRRLRNRLALRRGHVCAEIVAKGYRTPHELLDGWLSSDEHRAALENPNYTHTALGVFKNKDGIYFWTQMFLSL